LIVRNAFDHDSRVLRAAKTLKSLGYGTTVLAVVSFTERRQLTDRDGIEVRRIGPRTRFAWFIYRQVSSLAPTAAPGPGVAAGAPPDAPGGRPTAPTPLMRLLGPAKRLVRPFMRWAATLYYYGQGTAQVLRMKPDLVHCNDYNTVWIGLAARYLAGSGVIYDSHELWPDRNGRPEPRWWLVLCERLFVRRVHAVITASPGYSEEMARRYGIPEPPAICNVPELSDADRAALPPVRTNPGAGRVAVYVGGLMKNRGIEQSIRAITKVPGATLRLVGPGPPAFRVELERLIEETGARDQVEFVPPVPPDQVVQTLADADVGLCLIQPACLSYRLTMPNKLFEYTLAGLPVLGSAFPVIGRFIEQWEVGRAVDPENIDAIALALTAMLEPEANGAYREAAARAGREIDWKQEQDKLIAVYREVLPLPDAP
jgi:glycosyltransferase involved in cell wall biosynthesis